WLKTVGPLRKLRYRGLLKARWLFIFATAIYNLIRIRNLSEATA
ncbi:MAG: IS5/IS1182 family transposase, partial [Armatimonadota bacterium]|nr:IS5/IS1182 family transposase [Armatimonadota bacterium]